MKKLIAIFIIISYIFGSNAFPSSGILMPTTSLDPHVLNWLNANVSPATKMPYSFYISSHHEQHVFNSMKTDDPVSSAIERMITKGGLVIYDGAVYQMVQVLMGTPQSLEAAARPLLYYWDGAIKDTWNVRSGYPINQFIYDPAHPERVSSIPKDKGKRGFIFRIINADGDFVVSDPMTGKTSMEGFPGQERFHWVDWKPVAGENAWVVMAALQLYHQRYYNKANSNYAHPAESVELNLAKEIARAALILQAECGGIRMAPLGTHRNLSKAEEKDFSPTNWWYHQISTENNISWYAALRMLYQITEDEQYLKAMRGIERFMRWVWDPKEHVFHQGARWVNDQWVINKETFALDVQTWAIDAFGVAAIDRWIGPDGAWKLWQVSKRRSGVFDKQGQLQGVGFTDENDRLSVEWSAGAMMAVAALEAHYQTSNPAFAAMARRDFQTMRQGVEALRHKLKPGVAAYSYSSKRGWIPFGWYSHDPEVMSLASTGWMVFVDLNKNPFWFFNK